MRGGVIEKGQTAMTKQEIVSGRDHRTVGRKARHHRRCVNTIEGDWPESKVHRLKMNERNLKSVNVKVFIIINTNIGQRVSGLRTSVWGLLGLAVGQTGVSGDDGQCSFWLAEEGMDKRNSSGQGDSPSFLHPLLLIQYATSCQWQSPMHCLSSGQP